jgi:uncharacterized protein (TIGR03437 family)
MQLIHANPTAHPVGHGVRAGQVNYLTGSDRSLWRTGLPTYDRVTYEHLYAGIDLIYYGREGEVEYDFRVAAGADPGAIRMRYSGADAICIDAAGDLVLTTAAGEIRHRRPVIYQDWDGRRREIGGRYRLRGREVAFEIGAYDRRHELVIDPIVTYGSYIGGSDTDVGYGIGVDSAGNIYVGGETLSRDLPLKTPYQDAYRGNWDLFVTKIDPKGTVVYTTYLGGGGTEWFGGFAVDPAGNVVLSGYTDSANFPTSDTAPQSNNRGGFIFGSDCVLVKLDPTGSKLLFGTYLGGNDDDLSTALAVDQAGNVYVTGYTASTNFPSTVGVYQRNNKYANAFVAKYNMVTFKMDYATLVGGNRVDAARAIAVDASGNVYVAGSTTSTDFPTTTGAIQTTFRGGTTAKTDAFLFKLNANAGNLLYSTLLGGIGDEMATALAIDSTGVAYVGGFTNSSNFPLTSNALQSALSGDDAFIAKVNPTGTSLIYSTLLGGTRQERLAGLALDAAGNIYVAGTTSSSTFPVMAPFQQGLLGATDGFVTKLDSTGTKVLQSSYIGGTDVDEIFGMALDGNGNLYVTGDTGSTDFFVVNATQPKSGGGTDAFVARVNFADSNLMLSVGSTSLTFKGETGAALPHQMIVLTGVTGISVPWKAEVTATGGNWLSITPASGSGRTNIDVAVTTTGLAAGTYTGKVTIVNQVTGTALGVDVTLTLTKPADPGGTIPPTGVVNAASFQGGAVSPGELVTIFGNGIGPVQLTTLAVGNDGKVSNTLAETQVLFDNVPAPLVYVSASQVSAIVPYAVAGKSTTAVQIAYKGAKSNTLTVPVSSCAPALFTADSSGKGLAAVANQDGTYNGLNNPADKSTVITLYGTGEGQTDPPGVDGQPALSVYPKPILPVSVQIGSVDAPVLYYGAAPQMVAGVLQLNVRVPDAAPSGEQPIIVKVGSCSSPQGVTVAVK